MEQENKENAGGIHWSFWLIGIITLVWNILGIINFFAQMDPEVLAAYRETERAIIQGRPQWATVGFGAAVFGGAIGCVLLMLRQSAGFYFFVLSLIGVIAVTIHTLGKGIDFSVGEIIGIIIMPSLVAAFLIGYHRFAQNKGWVN